MSKLSLKFLFLIQIFQLFFAVNLLFAPMPASAADAQFTPEVPIPGAGKITMEKSTKPIAEYIRSIYNYGIGAVGIISAIVLMIGGAIWITAAGSSERIESAKSYIASSLMGLILAILAYSILNTINPALVNFKIKEIQNVDEAKNSNAVADEYLSQCVGSAIVGVKQNDQDSIGLCATYCDKNNQPMNLQKSYYYGPQKTYYCCFCISGMGDCDTSGLSCSVSGTKSDGYCGEDKICHLCLQPGSKEEKCSHNINNYECARILGGACGEKDPGDCNCDWFGLGSDCYCK